MFNDKSHLLVPRGIPGLEPLSIPMHKIRNAESRVQEVATVNTHKAPELLSAFNDAFLDLNEMIQEVSLCLHQAQQTAAKRRSIVILDEVPEILAKKGLSTTRSPGGSEDLRQAVLDSDVEYQRALDAVAHIKALRALLEGKQEGIVMAYTSVKKILGEQNSSSMSSRIDSRFSTASLPEQLNVGHTLTRAEYASPRSDEQAAPVPAAQQQAQPRWGKPKW